MGPGIEEICNDLRKDIQGLKNQVAELHSHPDFNHENGNLAPGNVPADLHGNMHANITLVFRALEDARMRVGKILQASQGGVSILDQ